MEVVENPERKRYEILVGDKVAGFVTYRRREGRETLVHTEVDPAFEGQGIGSRLAKGVLGLIRERAGTVAVTCSFLASYIDRHPEYADLREG